MTEEEVKKILELGELFEVFIKQNFGNRINDWIASSAISTFKNKIKAITGKDYSEGTAGNTDG